MASSTVQTTTTNNTHQNQNQIPVVPNLPPQSSSLSNNNNSNNTRSNPKKRPLDYNNHYTYLLQSSPYFKFRAILKDLRPLFLEVLRAPDFQNCEAARRIQEKMKLMMDLCRQPTAENVPLVKCNSAAGNRDFNSEKQGGQKPADQHPQEKRFSVGSNLEKPSHDIHRFPGTYIVGGSAFGWNFITFHGTKPEYYGRTKEAFRAGK
ncbi:K88 fimbrial protein AC [Bienertia sinuspersici]